jgi:hypothetical protein
MLRLGLDGIFSGQFVCCCDKVIDEILQAALGFFPALSKFHSGSFLIYTPHMVTAVALALKAGQCAAAGMSLK